jgi:succinate dehydrogenase/fumarate reductase flavoprotein subunit
MIWKSVGPVRARPEIERALADFDRIEKMLEDINTAPVREYNLEVLDAIEAGFMLKTARMIMTSAMVREESRGAHTRLDFPKKDDLKWLGNIVLWQEDHQLYWRFAMKEG